MNEHISLSDCSVYWECPDRFVLVERPSSAVPKIADAITMSVRPLSLSAGLCSQVVLRMREAGVRELSRQEYLAELKLPTGGRRGPQHVTSSEPSLAEHVRQADGRFQLVVGGQLLALHQSFEQILVVAGLGAGLKRLAPDDLSLFEAVMFDPKSGTEYKGHREIRLVHEITPDSLRAKRYPSARAWHFDRRELFVAADVRDALIEQDFPGLSFAPGFSQFAGLG